MVTGKELVPGGADQAVSSVEGDSVRMAEREGRFPARMIVKLRSVIKSRVPVGFEDASGFHYGANSAG